jgi:hypothetical protein
MRFVNRWRYSSETFALSDSIVGRCCSMPSSRFFSSVFKISRQTSDDVYVGFTGQRKLVLHLFERGKITGNQRAIEFVNDFFRAFGLQINVDATARKSVRDDLFHFGFHRLKLIRHSQVDVQKTIVDGFDFDVHGKIFCRNISASVSGH